MTNQELNARINELWTVTKRGELPRQARFAVIEQLAEEYMAETGRRPEPAMLDRLATLCLYEEVTDATPWKTQNTEYPIHSARQQEEIEKNEVNRTPPNKYGKPKRRKRSDYENTVVNRAKSRNKERRRKYREFVKVQPVKRWNMYTGEVYE